MLFIRIIKVLFQKKSKLDAVFDVRACIHDMLWVSFIKSPYETLRFKLLHEYTASKKSLPHVLHKA